MRARRALRMILRQAAGGERAEEEPAPGTFVTVRFTGTMDGELTGEAV